MRHKYVGAVAAKGELGAVAVRRDSGRDKLRLVSYAPRSIGEWKNREEFNRLVVEAAAKIGLKPSKRAKCGWTEA